MTVTQRGDLNPTQMRILEHAKANWREAEDIRAAVRETCVWAMGESSIRAVAEATGFSTNTLQRWKREAGK